MLNKLKALNPEIKFATVTDKAFAPFGRVLNIDASAVITAANAIPLPSEGSSYVASEPAFEALPVSEALRTVGFGELPVQVGYCWGHSNRLNALEWHKCSEINVAVTDLVLLLAPLYKLVGNRIDSSEVRGFFVPAGTCIEVYATSMHFCPIQVSDAGFGCVVVLPVGTNVPLKSEPAEPTLFRKNKWIICCDDNEALKSRGVVAGIGGTNYTVKY